MNPRLDLNYPGIDLKNPKLDCGQTEIDPGKPEIDLPQRTRRGHGENDESRLIPERAGGTPAVPVMS